VARLPCFLLVLLRLIVSGLYISVDMYRTCCRRDTLHAHPGARPAHWQDHKMKLIRSETAKGTSIVGVRKENRPLERSDGPSATLNIARNCQECGNPNWLK